jgi:hypothetical protein
MDAPLPTLSKISDRRLPLPQRTESTGLELYSQGGPDKTLFQPDSLDETAGWTAETCCQRANHYGPQEHQGCTEDFGPAGHRISEGIQRRADSLCLADQFGIHRTTVSAHLHRQGIPLRRQGLSPDNNIAQAQRFYAEGWSLAHIGERLNVDAHTVRRALTARGVRMRDTHARER